MRSRLFANLLLVVASATAVAITQLERVPLALTQAWFGSTVLNSSLLSLKNNNPIRACLYSYVFIVYIHLYSIKRFAYCRYNCASEVTHVTSTPLVGINGLSTATANKHRTVVTLDSLSISRYTVHTGSGAHSLRSRDSKERGDDPFSLTLRRHNGG